MSMTIDQESYELGAKMMLRHLVRASRPFGYRVVCGLKDDEKEGGAFELLNTFFSEHSAFLEAEVDIAKSARLLARFAKDVKDPRSLVGDILPGVKPPAAEYVSDPLSTRYTKSVPRDWRTSLPWHALLKEDWDVRRAMDAYMLALDRLNSCSWLDALRLTKAYMQAKALRDIQQKKLASIACQSPFHQAALHRLANDMPPGHDSRHLLAKMLEPPHFAETAGQGQGCATHNVVTSTASKRTTKSAGHEINAFEPPPRGDYRR